MAILQRLWNVFRPGLNDEIRLEMETHLALMEQEGQANGLSAEAARRNARLRFGSSETYRDRTRSANLLSPVEDFWQDLRFAARQLKRSPGFAVSSVMMLALGIGLNAAIFAIINSVILRPLPLPEPDRLVSVVERNGIYETPASWPDLLDLRQGNHVFLSSGGFTRGSTFVIRPADVALNVTGSYVTPEYFTTLGARTIAGRTFDAAEGEGRNAAVLLREDFWRTAFNADPEILRRTILVDGRAASVIGVLPASLRFPTSDSVIWMPLAPQGPEKSRGWHAFSMVGRLKAGATIAQAQSDLEIIMRRLASEYPDQNAGRTAKVVAYQNWSLDENMRDRLLLLQVAAAALFLMAFANVSSLLLARYSTRRGEFAIRAALGASQSRQTLQHITESLLVTGLGCAGAVGVAWAGVRLLVWLYGDQLPRASEISPDWLLVAIVIVVALIGAVAMGLVTVFHERRSELGLAAGAHRSTVGRHGALTRKILVVFQVSCSVVLLSATGEVLQSFRRLLSVDAGFDRSQLLTMRVNLPSALYRNGPQVGELFEKMAARVRDVNGVRSVAAINMLPIAAWGFNGGVNVEGLDQESGVYRGFFAEYRWITQDYFRTMGIPLLRGRLFLPEETAGKQRAAVINATMARRLWGTKDPLGARIHMFSPEWITVVGVVKDILQSGVSSPASSEVFLPARGYVGPFPNWSLVIRTSQASAAVVSGVRGAVRVEEPEAAIDQVKSMDDAVGDSLGSQRIVATLLSLFAALAILLAALGLYGLVSFSVAARFPELAVRAALGSSPRALVRLAGREGLALILIGAGIGLAAMIPLHRFLAGFLFGVTHMSVSVLGLVLVILFSVGGAAVLAPASRVARIDPLRALRQE